MYQSLWRRLLTEVNCTIAICINFIDHVLKLSFCWVLAKGAHDSSEFFGGNCSIAVCGNKWIQYDISMSSLVFDAISLPSSPLTFVLCRASVRAGQGQNDNIEG